jgi:23S rRNA (guanosine2251-2'-O)-methyltransferase
LSQRDATPKSTNFIILGRPVKYTKKRPKPNRKPGGDSPSENAHWLWGTHAVLAALNNPVRQVLKLYVSKNAAAHLPKDIATIAANMQEISSLLPDGAVHQGLALLTRPLPGAGLDDILAQTSGVLLMLDGITDPRNIGAIFRSAAAFGALGIIAQERHMPPLSGVLAKAATGAVESVAHIGVVNLSRTLEELAQAGWFSIGLAGDTRITIAQALNNADKVCLVLGSEGKGLRPNVAKHCDQLARIPISSDMESLNVSTAAAIALYEAGRG